jgi:hypothetical protein
MSSPDRAGFRPGRPRSFPASSDYSVISRRGQRAFTLVVRLLVRFLGNCFARRFLHLSLWGAPLTGSKIGMLLFWLRLIFCLLELSLEGCQLASGKIGILLG